MRREDRREFVVRVVGEAVYVRVSTVWKAATQLAAGEGQEPGVGRSLQVVRALEKERAASIKGDDKVAPRVLCRAYFNLPALVEGVRGAGGKDVSTRQVGEEGVDRAYAGRSLRTCESLRPR